jgi:metallophosphoesterase (TIGR00282 family)
LRILFVGDIYGRPGREAVGHFVPLLRRDKKIDFVVGNVENAAGGRGLTDPVAKELFAAGIDVFTLGNHTWDRKETLPLLQDLRILRPANYPPSLPGKGLGVYPVNGKRVAVLQLMGRLHLDTIDCPFRAADALLKDLAADVVFVDMHAEASSEKQAMGWYLDGRVAAVVGTHTHVQTADERILTGRTAYIGDVGMAGPRDGIIGGERAPALERFLTGVRVRLSVAEGDAQFCAVIVDVDESTGRARTIERVNEIYHREPSAGKRPALPGSHT